MKWSEKDFRARVKAHVERQGITLTELLNRAELSEDYFRHPPEGGRNIAGILRIAEVLSVSPAELMGLELSNLERRSTMMIAHLMAHIHFNIMRANGDDNGLDIETIVGKVLAALRETTATAKPRRRAAAPARTK